MSERLDRIEANIERVSEQLEALAVNQIALHREVEATTQTVQQNSAACIQITQDMNTNISELVSMIGYVAETGEENRQEIRRISR